MILLDTDVLVECLRGSEKAKSWLETLSTETLAIPGVAAMELVMGCQNRLDLEQTQRFLEAFPVTWPDAAEFASAYDLLSALRLSVGIGIPDCLIAAIAISRRARLYTFNLKHFRAVPGLDVAQPYSRT